MGDGVYTFGIPDYRGYFLRGWNHNSNVDPDAKSRNYRPDGKNGDVIGTIQQHQIQNHKHKYTDKYWEWFKDGGCGENDQYKNSHYTFDVKYTDDINNANVGSETRHINIYVVFAIKAK